MMKTEKEQNTKLINNGFSYINEKFLNHDWNLIKNTFSEIIYKKDTSDMDEFIIKINEKNIEIYIPFKNNNVTYKTIFSNYFDASEFLELHINVYNETL